MKKFTPCQKTCLALAVINLVLLTCAVAMKAKEPKVVGPGQVIETVAKSVNMEGVYGLLLDSFPRRFENPNPAPIENLRMEVTPDVEKN